MFIGAGVVCGVGVAAAEGGVEDVCVSPLDVLALSLSLPLPLPAAPLAAAVDLDDFFLALLAPPSAVVDDDDVTAF